MSKMIRRVKFYPSASDEDFDFDIDFPVFKFKTKSTIEKPAGIEVYKKNDGKNKLF